MSTNLTWDLSDLYDGILDPRIEEDMRATEKKARKLKKTYHSAISTNTSSADLKVILDDYVSVIDTVHKLSAFAHLTYSTHTTSEEYGAFRQHISTWTLKIQSDVLFVKLDISKLPADTLTAHIQHEQLKEYRHFLVRQRNWSSHRLPEEVEHVMDEKALTGPQALLRIYDQEATLRTYAVKMGEKTETMNISEVTNLLHHPDQEYRRAAAKARHEPFRKNNRINPLIYNMIVQDYDLESRRRKFPYPASPRYLSDEIDKETVDILSSVVTESYSVVHDYYAFKKELLGLTEQFEYDRYAPVANTAKTFTFPEAQEIVLDAFQEFSPVFANIAKKFFDNRWIDVMPSQTKRGGAYCMYVTPDTHPYVLLNFTGSMNDVSTLAHELGHAIHGYLAQHNHILHFDWPTTISETASVFGEMVVFHRLRDTLSTKEEKLALYASKIEGIFASVYRQITMYEFELEVHKRRSKEGELSSEQFNEIWRRGQENMFGESLTVSEYEDTYWNVIPHIFHYPFYVYSYAFGDLMVRSLFSIYSKNPEAFVPMYIDMLSAGGSKSPQELLDPFEITLHDRLFWEGGIREIQSLVQEAKDLTEE